MKAAVIESPRRASVRTMNLPELQDGWVRVRLEGCGVCGSNLPAWQGRPWFRYPLAPGELGHEGWGTIDAVGADVGQLQRGDRVAMLSYHAYAEYDIAPASTVVPLPEELDGQPFPGEAIGCAMNVFARSDIQREHTVAIVGVGFLGMLLVSLAAAAGARVIAISRRGFALEMAQNCGAQQIVQTDNDTVQRVMALTDGKGCDRVIEAAGLQSALDLASEITCVRGRLVIAGYHQDGPRHVNLQLWNWRGLDVINAHERDPQAYVSGIKAAADAVASGRLNISSLLTHRFQLDQIGDALESMQTRPDGFLKGIIRL